MHSDSIQVQNADSLMELVQINLLFQAYKTVLLLYTFK